MPEHSSIWKRTAHLLLLIFFPLNQKLIHSSKEHCIYLNEMHKRTNFLKMSSLFFAFEWFEIWRLADPGEIALPKASQSLEIVSLQSAPQANLSKCKATNPGPSSPTPSPNSSHTQGDDPPTLITPGPATTQWRTAPVYQHPLKFFKLTNPTPAYPAQPVSSRRNHNKGF